MEAAFKLPRAGSAYGCSSGLAHARQICTSDECPMSHILSAMPALCEPAPPRHSQTRPDDALVQQLDDFHKLTGFPDHVWGPAKWTALESEILTLPAKLDEHEFCMFKVYLALNARYLPCINCARHFEEHIQRMPNTDIMRTRAGLLKWLTDVHNDVNRRKHREQLTHAEIMSVLSAKASSTAPAGNDDLEKKTAPEASEKSQAIPIPTRTTTTSQSSGALSSESELGVLWISATAVLVIGLGFSLLHRATRQSPTRRTR